jgi:hypothetical protein
VTSAEEILKNKGDRTKFQNDANFSKFSSGNQSVEEDENISKSTLEKRATLHLSDEDSHKLLLLASALESSDTSNKMSDSKLQKCLFDSAKKLKLREFKYDSNPCVCRHLLKSFYNQLVSILSSVESFDGVVLEDYEVHPFEDPNGAPNKALFRLLLTYVDTHYKMIIRRKETNGFGDKSVLALQAQCASLTLVEQNNTQHDFTGMRIAPRESLSSYLHRFLMARDKAETAGNEYTNNTLVDLFLSSLGTDNTAYYSILHTTLENQHADGQTRLPPIIIMVKTSHGVPPSLEIPRNIVLLIVVIVAMIPDPSCALVVTSQGIKSLNVLKGRRGILPTLVQLGDDQLPWPHKKFIMQAWPR